MKKIIRTFLAILITLGLLVTVPVLPARADCTEAPGAPTPDVWNCDSTPNDTDGMDATTNSPTDDVTIDLGATVDNTAADLTTIDMVAGTLTNNGTVSNNETSGAAIFASGDSDITNNGTVSAPGDSGTAVFTLSGDVTNAGNVQANGLSATGILTDTGNVVNDGTVSTNGDSGTGILTDTGNNTVTHNGTVSATGLGGIAILTGPGNDTVTIGASATVNGVIDGGADTDTLAFAAFTPSQLAGLNPAAGTFGGYSWVNFEQLTGLLPSPPPAGFINWVGGVAITSDHNIIPIGRPEIGGQITSYNGFNSGSTTMYVPMLFKDAFGGSYDAALYIQNIHPINSANITIKYYDTRGNLSCTVNDTIARLSAKGYWLPSISCLGTSWVGAAVITSDQNIVAVGRPHIGNEILTYSGFAIGNTSMYVPMLFKDAFGGNYDSALYLQNTSASNLANVTIQYYDTAGNLVCTMNDILPQSSSKGYWLPGISCLGPSWVGAAFISSDQNIVALGRPHIENQIMAYGGFASGLTTAYVPMLSKDASGGSYDSALYIQNVNASSTANLTLKFYDTSGNLTCTLNDTIARLSSKGYWLPQISCLGSSWQGAVTVESDLGVVAVGRPHLGSEIMSHDGAASGNLQAYLPMLFRDAFGGSYDATITLLNVDSINTAHLTLKFFDTAGNLSCTKTATIPAQGTLEYFLPSITCDP